MIQIRYAFRYNQVDYTGNKVDLIELAGGFRNYRKPQGEEKIAEVKEQMDVYVNPDNPTEAVMERGGIGFYFLIFFIGVLSLIIGIAKLF